MAIRTSRCFRKPRRSTRVCSSGSSALHVRLFPVFFDFAVEVCDASMAYTQEHLEEVGGSFLPGNTWCPWGSQLEAEIPAPEGAVQALTAVSAASFSEVALAAASIATIFGNGITNRTESASGTPWPVSLAGVSVKLRSTAAGNASEYEAQLAFASASQVNFFVPSDLPDGVAEIALHAADGRTLRTFSRIERLAPALFHIGPVDFPPDVRHRDKTGLAVR